MKALLTSLLQTQKKFLHSINPHEAQVIWNGNQLTGTPNYQFSETWELMDIGYDHETDITLRILLSEWPGIPERGDKLFLLGSTFRVDARDRTGDGSECMLLLKQGD